MSFSFVRSFFQVCAFNCLIVYFHMVLLKVSVNGDTVKIKPRDTINIKCINSSTIHIEAVDVGNNPPIGCQKESCDFYSKDLNTIRSHCENEHLCTLKVDFQTPCLFGSNINISYTCKAPDKLQCSFETNEIFEKRCLWYQDKTRDIADWVQRRGQDTHFIGPNTDHTTGKDFGFYYILEGATESTFASLYSSKLSSNSTKCLILWYNLKGSAFLSVFIIKDEANIPIDTLSIAAGIWTEANMDINITGVYSIGIKGFVTQPNSNNYVAIDDVDVIDGSCADAKIIKSIDTFERGLGHWQEHQVDQGLSWSQQCIDDKTTGELTDGGCIIAISAQNTKGRLSLKREIFNTTFSNYCLTFWYAVVLQIDYEATILIYKINDTGAVEVHGSIKLKANTGGFGNDWKKLSIDFQNAKFKNYTLTIEVIFDEESQNTRIVMFDEIILQEGFCQKNKTVIQTCIDAQQPITIEDCPGIYIADDVTIHLDNDQLVSAGTNCQRSDFEKSVYQQCQNSSDYSCTFHLELGECLREERNININYSCLNELGETTLSPFISTVTVHSNDSHSNETTLGYSLSSLRDLSNGKYTTSLLPKYKDIQTENEENSSMLGIVLGIVGAVVLLVVIMAITCFVKRKSKLKTSNKQDEDRVHFKANSQTIEHNYATPNKIKKTQNQNGQANDVYGMTEDGVYDVSNEPRREKTNTEANMYDHSVENVYDKSGGRGQHDTANAEIYDRTTDNTYDTSGHNFRSTENDQGLYDLNTNTNDDGPNVDKTYDVSANMRQSSRNDETYDHFFGQQTEDEYDMTVRA